MRLEICKLAMKSIFENLKLKSVKIGNPMAGLPNFTVFS